MTCLFVAVFAAVRSDQNVAEGWKAVNCHGPDLKGVGPVPGIAGRSPSYIVRQLYDFQQGVRAGSASDLMKPTVAKLAQEDMISLAAYIASLEP